MFQEKRVIYQRIGAAAGLISPIVAFTSILIAIAFYPAFSWTNNALSDLGVVSGITETTFNFGLYTSGLLGFGFAIFGLFTYFGKSIIGKIGTGAFAAATLALMAIGFFNESFTPTHYWVSVAFFTLVPIALFILTCAFYLNRNHRMAVFTVAIGIAAALPWILQFAINYVPNVAIPEAVSALAVSVWTIVLAQKMLKAKTASLTESSIS
ncbi:MAG: DUF998 domain-containing protein [Candidatus Bathyarchaeota archaeon]|nr:DUF998 domain-containing protein [Candidatus Bathyarchaeota archaeon]